MPTSYILEDDSGNNFVDEFARKIDEHGAVYYELKGRNSMHQPRILNVYDKNLVKAYIERDGALIEATSLGHVHKQMQQNIPVLLKHLLPDIMNFTPPYIIHDAEGGNYVNLVTRKIDERV